MSLLTVKQLHRVVTDLVEAGCGDYVVFAVPDDASCEDGFHVTRHRTNPEGVEAGTLDLIYFNE